MIILGIETSCDETSASVVENGTLILSNVVASSQEMHIKTGGIIPEMAAREQVRYMMPVIEEALKTGCGWVVSCEQNPITHNSSPPIDAIAVTVGPGLIGSLLVGVETAKTLAYLWHKPIIPVNHLLAHVYANWLISERLENSERQTIRSSDNLKIRNSESPSLPSFPNIALIVSGGHTELLLMKNHEEYEVLGGTRDDAAGECFDKIARLLGLGYPGGPAIAAAAAASVILGSEATPESETDSGQARMTRKIYLPRPMIDSKDFDFSFSGLKTAVLREVNKYKNYNNYNDYKIYLAYEVQEAITDVLVEKTIRAAREKNVKSILLSGGVAANDLLRQKFKVQSSKFKVKFFAPAKNLCTDNAAPIASCAFFNYKEVPWQKIQANPSLTL